MEEKAEKKSSINPAEFISLSKAAKISGYTAEHLNLLCRKKILKGQKVGRNWNTTEEWLADYLASDSRNAHKRKLKKPEKKDRHYFKKRFTRKAKKINTEISRETYSSHLSSQQDTKNFSKQESDKYPTEENLTAEEKTFSTQPIAIYADRVETKKSSKKNKLLWMNLATRFSFLILVGLLFFSGAPVVRYIWNNYEFIGEDLPVDVLQDSFLFSNEPGKMEVAQTGKVKGETSESAIGSIAMSENFRLQEISFGGVLLASANGENLPLEISDIKTKNFISKDGKEAQALISWRTNKEAVSEISYSRIDSQAGKTMQEEYFGFNHAAVLTGLDMGATYVFEITARDKWDRTVLSQKFSIYTGSKVVSVFDLIIKAINDTFGWAMKK